MTKHEFVQQAYAAALCSSQRSAMPALVTVAQAALESNWGHSKLSQEANNYFGIKAHGKHQRIQMCTMNAKPVQASRSRLSSPSISRCSTASSAGMGFWGEPLFMRAQERSAAMRLLSSPKSQSTGLLIPSTPGNFLRF